MYVFQFLLLFTISTTRVLPVSSRRTYFPSGINRPKLVEVVVTGHSVTHLLVSVFVFPASLVDLTCVVRHPSSTSVPLIVVVVVVSVWVGCAQRYPAKTGTTKRAA